MSSYSPALSTALSYDTAWMRRRRDLASVHMNIPPLPPTIFGVPEGDLLAR